MEAVTQPRPRSGADPRPSGPLLAVGLLVLLCLGLPASVGAAGPAAASYELEARYGVQVHLDWDTRRVKVKTAIDLFNTSDGVVDRVHLNSVAAKHGRIRKLNVKAGGEPVTASVKGQTITLTLPTPLAPGEGTALWVAFRARLTTTQQGRAWFFSKLGNVAHLYRFIPWLSRPIPFGPQGHGEPFLTPMSPRVEVTLSSDRKLVWATSGRRTSTSGPRTFTFVATKVRDFNIAASPAYRTVSGTSKDGQTKIVAHTLRHDGRRLVRLAREELARYERYTGVQYPHPTYRIAESGGGLAMESPALIWIPSGRGPADHPFLVSHETAHQWWYSTVGNDQSTDAFADEAMADYFARKAHLSIRSSRCRMDRLDRDIRDYSSTCYFEVIYVQGARFLDKLRQDFGRAKFKAAIRRYTKDHRHDVGSNAELLEAFRAEMGDKVLKRFRARFPSLY